MRTLPRFRPARTQLFTLFWVAALTTQLSGQSNRFTVDDVLEVANISVADLSSDGRWIVATSGTLRDRLGNDNRRFGDPSYLAPGNMDLLVIDTRSGESRKVFSDRRQVR